METKILYVLVSNKEDIFWEQTYISMYSLRKHNPKVKVSLLTDDVTDASLIGVRSRILDLVDERVVVNLEKNLSNKYKSRVLKTDMRNYVDGNFLYIDSDTIILDDLSDIDNVDYDLAAVYEFNKSIKENPGKKSALEPIERIGGKFYEDEEYYNSGVVYVKDKLETRDFFKSWYETWLKGTRLNVFFDQPALGIVNHKFGNIISQLSGDWNCQGRYGSRFYRTAKIFHYLYDASYNHPLMDKKNFKEVKETGIISEDLEHIINNPFVYLSPVNEVITGEDVLLIHSRFYSLLRLLQAKYTKLFYGIDRINEKLYKIYLNTVKKKRKLAPPR